MALTLAIIPGYGASYGVAGRTINYVASVTNSGSSSVTLQSLAAYPDNSTCVSVGQPNYLTPNVPVGVGNPTIAAGATSFFPFEVTFMTPNFSGPSPQAPGGNLGSTNASVPGDSVFGVTLQSLSSDASVASTTLLVPVLSAVAPFPVAQGGALQLSSGFNLVNFLTSFA